MMLISTIQEQIKPCRLQLFKTCDLAADYFKTQCFPDIDEFNYDSFCEKFNILKHMSKHQQNQLVITELFGYNLSLLENHQLNNIEQNEESENQVIQYKNATSNSCQAYSCSVQDIVQVKKYVYSQLDLRKLNLISKNPTNNNQKTCGSCAYYSTRRMIENLLLRTNNSLAGNDISVQYLMSNSFGLSEYCGGSNCFRIINYLTQLSPYKTLQLWDDFPYNPGKYKGLWQSGQYLEPNYQSQAYIETNNNLPWKVFPYKSNSNSNLSRMIFVIRKDNFIQEVKNALNSGIIVAVNMQVDFMDLSFSFYNGRSVLTRQFNHNYTNHQVVIVGYTIMDNEECWIILNSHGSQWGDNGFGYIRMGHNDYNIEQIGYYIISDQDINNTYISNLSRKNYLNKQEYQRKQESYINLKLIDNPGYQLIENNGIPNYEHKLSQRYLIIVIVLTFLTLFSLLSQLGIVVLRKRQQSDLFTQT